VFTLVFIVIGLFASSVQAAQGLSLVAFVFAFLSSTYVPASSMPGWLQLFAKYQPITPMVDAVRALILGSGSDVVLALAWSAVLLAVFTPIAALRYRRS
jgi:ABC-2 type transport system permease protein